MGAKLYEPSRGRTTRRKRHLPAVSCNNMLYPHPLRRQKVRCRQDFNAPELGIGPADALHLASAVEAEADVLCTTDDQFLRRSREVDTGAMRVLTPIELIDHIES